MTTQRMTIEKLGQAGSWAVFLLLALATSNGCHRSYYRQKADKDAYSLIAEKANHPHWALENFDIEVDPRSRMFDPFDRDRPPMPPDDLESHQYMHWVDGKRGYPCWHANGDTIDLENPYWREYLPLNEEGVLVLDARTAIKLALIHSRDYQSQLESLYLSALDVSFERFRFDTQFFGGYTTDYNADGPLRGGAGDSQSVMTLATLPSVDGIRAERMFATGADLVVGLANSLIWQFSGPDTYAATTLLDFTLVQPLLRNGGRDRVMERLTLAERSLLANVRQMERFRRGFSLEIMTGVDAGQGPSRRGGVFGAGLTGFTGVGGGFGGVGGGTSGFTGGGGTGAGQAGGFMGLLQSQQEIQNLKDNLEALESNYNQLLAMKEDKVEKEQSIPIKPAGETEREPVFRHRLQVAQALQAVLNAKSRLKNERNSYESRLDRFKTTLGLPPHICVEIKDEEFQRKFKRLQAIDPKMRRLQDRVDDLRERRVGVVVSDLLEILIEDDAQGLAGPDQLKEKLLTLKADLDEVKSIHKELMEGDDAVIRGVRTDGVTLGSKLVDVLEESIRRHEDDGWDEESIAELRRSVILLRDVLEKVKDEEDWLAEWPLFISQSDAIDDSNRLLEQIERGGRVEIGWMQSDANPITSGIFDRYGDDIEALNSLGEDERPPVVARLIGQLSQEIEPIAYLRYANTADNPWLLELDRWKTAADETDRLGRIKALFVQFIDMLADVPSMFNTLPDKIEDHQARIDALIADAPTLSPEQRSARFRRDISPAIPQDLNYLDENVLELSLVQAHARAETVLERSMTNVNLHPAAALEIARPNRRDWMNARAALVDSWRLVEFNADDLESTLDVVFSGDMSNRDDNPFKLDSATGRLRAAVQFDAPLTRLSERNTYRQALIEYQQARRNYYAYRDQVALGLRDTLRTLQVNQQNFEIRRDAVREAITQTVLNQRIRRLERDKRQPIGPTAARDTVSALGDLLTAQNDLLSIWVTHEVLRQTLDFNLGTMQLDFDGIWLDPGPIGPEQGYPGIGGDEPCWPGKMDVPENGWMITDLCTDVENLESSSPAIGHALPEPELLPGAESAAEPH